MYMHKDSVKSLSAHNRPVFLTALPAANMVGITRATLTKHLKPDAWYESASGAKTYPLWLRSTVEVFSAEYWAKRAASL